MHMATKAATQRKKPVSTTATPAPSTGKTPAKRAVKKTAAPAKEIVTKSPSPAAAKTAVTARLDTKKRKNGHKKQKTIRDSFNMPADDYALIGKMKKRAIAAGRDMKKSELLRAGLKALAGMNDAAYSQALGAVAAIKTGRPANKRK
jgi:hypothetical protein